MQVRVFEKQYGYILIPSIETDRQGVDRWGKRIMDSLCSISPNQLRGLIIDLRFNQGGNLFAMVGGLARLIGEGVVGYLADSDEKLYTTWKIDKGAFYVNETKLIDIAPSCNMPANLPIVILTSEMTANAGEGLAIMFKGRSNAILLGKKTWGVSSSTLGYGIDGDSFVMVTKGFMVDRDRAVYKQGVNPDCEVLGEDNIEQPHLDKKIAGAIKWLKETVDNSGL